MSVSKWKCAPDFPRPKRSPIVSELHGDRRTDDYAWLRDKENPEVRAHLEAENAYAAQALEPWKDLQEKIFEELKSRILPEDQSVPEKRGDWFVYFRDIPGKEYPLYCRKKGSLQAEPEVMLDLNAWVGKDGYLGVGDVELSPDLSRLAFSIDRDGSEHHEVRILDLATGKLWPEVLEDVSGGLAWSKDGSILFYCLLNDQDRPDRVFRHRLGTSQDQDVEIYFEKDARYWLGVELSRSEAFVFIASEAKNSTEIWVVPADQPEAAPRCIEPRTEKLEYTVDHRGSEFWILNNADGAREFQLCSAPVSEPGRTNWKVRLPTSNDRTLVSADAFESGLIVSLRRGGLTRLSVYRPESEKEQELEFQEAAFEVAHLGTGDFDAPDFRFSYESLTQPPQVWDVKFSDLSRTLRKERKVPGYDPALYVSETGWAQSLDGTRVPLFWVRRKDTLKNAEAPVLLDGYGAYGIPNEPGFSSSRLSLLDRGFLYAISQVRGGSELGRHWYDAGKFQLKARSFEDFEASAEFFVKEGWCQPGGVALYGGSAGGLLVGATLQRAPERFAAALALVPFVDVLNTMLDPTLPLTQPEYEEWGNPEDPAIYRAMREYSPYDTVKDAAYPPLFIQAGWNDPRVTYWEPAKWCARLRDHQKGDAPILLHTDLGAGHGGTSGRYGHLKDVARMWVFLFAAFGKTKTG